jgi:hypothetical protein
MLKTFIKALAPPISIVMGIQGFKIGRCRVRLFRHTKEKILIVPQPLTILSESPQYFSIFFQAKIKNRNIHFKK